MEPKLLDGHVSGRSQFSARVEKRAALHFVLKTMFLNAFKTKKGMGLVVQIIHSEKNAAIRNYERLITKKERT